MCFSAVAFYALRILNEASVFMTTGREVRAANAENRREKYAFKRTRNIKVIFSLCTMISRRVCESRRRTWP